MAQCRCWSPFTQPATGSKYEEPPCPPRPPPPPRPGSGSSVSAPPVAGRPRLICPHSGAVPGYGVRALSASSPTSAKAAGDKYGIPLAFGSAEELVWRDEVDLVVVAVKVPHHRELILPALEAGKMILCDWPLGNGLAEAEELAAVAEAQGSAPLWVYRPAQLPRSDTSGT
jgi:hypothetical protein